MNTAEINRRVNSEAGRAELAASIEAHGLIHNLVTRKAASLAGGGVSPVCTERSGGRWGRPPATASWERGPRASFPLTEETCRQAHPYRRSHAARAAATKKGVQGGSTEMPASGTKPFRCWRKFVALRPVQQGGRRSISIAPPTGGMRDRQPPAKGADSSLFSEFSGPRPSMTRVLCTYQSSEGRQRSPVAGDHDRQTLLRFFLPCARVPSRQGRLANRKGAR